MRLVLGGFISATMKHFQVNCLLSELYRLNGITKERATPNLETKLGVALVPNCVVSCPSVRHLRCFSMVKAYVGYSLDSCYIIYINIPDVLRV